MKMQDFKFTGDVNALVMAMLSGGSYELTGELNRVMEVHSVGTVTSAMILGERMMTVPVKIVGPDVEAVMSFRYKVEDKVVAPSVKAVEAVEERPTVYGVSDEGEARCWKTDKGLRFGENYFQDGVLLGAKEYLGYAARPAIAARPEVKVPQFCRCGTDYHTLTIKFE